MTGRTLLMLQTPNIFRAVTVPHKILPELDTKPSVWCCRCRSLCHCHSSRLQVGPAPTSS